MRDNIDIKNAMNDKVAHLNEYFKLNSYTPTQALLIMERAQATIVMATAMTRKQEADILIGLMEKSLDYLKKSISELNEFNADSPQERSEP